MKNSPKKIAIMSGKGGVGKSSISILLSMILQESHKVLLLDFDICGPTIQKALNVTGTIKKAKTGLVPLQATDNLFVLSMGNIINDDDAVIWRGPKKLSLLQMFYESINNDFDFVIVDLPPGLSEEHKYVIQHDINVIVVTTSRSRNVALSDTVRNIEYCKNNQINILGVVENMSGYECGKCKTVTNIFAKGGASELCKYYELKGLCSLPVDREFGRVLDLGVFREKYKELKSYKILKDSIIDIL